LRFFSQINHFPCIFLAGYKKEILIDRDSRSRSRSRSRDRENFSESVWDRSEVEGPSSNNGTEHRERDKEREKRERNFEIYQIQRERESNKVYQPPGNGRAINNTQQSQQHQQQQYRDNKVKQQQIITTERATFKTHMAQKSAQERERKNSVSSTLMSHHSDKRDEIDNIGMEDFTSPLIPAPVLAPPSLKSPAAACMTYNRVPWQLKVRKEVFRPSEAIGPPAALDLMFVQVASDVLGVSASLRIAPQERRSALNLLGGHGVTAENMKTHVRAIVKRHLVDMARGWPLYFARLFVVSGSPQFPEVTFLAVSHSGVYLARRDSEYIQVLKSIPFSELNAATTLPRPGNFKRFNKYKKVY
jgi:myosin XV